MRIYLIKTKELKRFKKIKTTTQFEDQTKLKSIK
jgi:hypothetical protein